MRKYTIFLAACLSGAAVAIGAYPQQWSDLDKRPTPVEINRELPRTRTVSYPSQAAALEGSSTPSRYFQPVTDWVKGTDNDGNVIYSAKYKVPFEWAERRYFLHIGSATSGYMLLVNGDLAGYNQSGATAAEFDLTDVSTEGLNRIELILFKDPASAVLQSDRKAPAITGETYIVSQPRIRIRDYTARANLAGEATSLELGVIVKSHLLNPKTVRVYYSLLDPDGEAGPYGHRDADFEMKLEDTVRFFVNIPDARQWSHESPNLYTLLLRLQHEGRYTEYVAYRLGLRSAGMDGSVFTVNGNPVQLHVAEYAFAGDLEAAERDLRDLRNSGMNTIKVKGSPPPDGFYALCDRIGLYVCNQADIDTRSAGMSRARGGNPSNDPQWEEAYTDRALTMYHTSKNHPSVVMFSLAENSANGYNLYESYLAAKAVEHDRPVIYLDGGGEWNTDALYSALHAKYPEGLTARVRLEEVPETAREQNLPSIAAISAEDISDYEMTQLRQTLDPSVGSHGFYSLRNNSRMSELRSPLVKWQVKQGKKVVSQGEYRAVKTVAPGNVVPLAVHYGKAKSGKPVTVEFTVYRPRETFDPPAAPSGKKNKTEIPGFIKLAEQTLSTTP